MERSICSYCAAVVMMMGLGVEAVAQTPEQSAYEERIKKLEDRVAFLEQALADVLEKRTEPNAPAPSSPLHVPPRPASARYEPPPELVPEVGKIGAQVGLLLGGATSPFKLNSGSFTGGFIDLRLVDRPAWLHGKLSYEISVGISQSKTTFTTTSNVAQVANLAVLNTLNPTGGLANVIASVTGTGPAPFPVTIP